MKKIRELLKLESEEETPTVKEFFCFASLLVTFICFSYQYRNAIGPTDYHFLFLCKILNIFSIYHNQTPRIQLF